MNALAEPPRRLRAYRALVFALLVLAFASPGFGDVVKITIDGPIHAITDEFIGRTLGEAKSRGDQLVLIELRTPGGLETATRSIVNKLLASSVPVAVYVSPGGSRAASAGFFILISADVAAMAPGTNTGAAHPVLITGGEKIDAVMNQKMENDSAAFMRSVAAKRGRNVAAAESAVRQSVSFTEQEALAAKVIDLVARDERELLRMLNGRAVRRFDGSTTRLDLSGTQVRTKQMTLKQQILGFLMDPNIAFVLLSLGMLALWAEFNNPGAILPGVVGGVAVLLAIFALNLLPTRFASLFLIAAAFVLFALEAKFTSHGILGAGGVVCMTLGALLLVDGPIPEMRVNLLTALAVSVPLGIIAVFLMTIALRAMKNRVTTGAEGLVGEIGVARSDLSPAGKIFVHGEIWDARSATPIRAGERVVVTQMEGFLLHVDRASEGAADPSMEPVDRTSI